MLDSLKGLVSKLLSASVDLFLAQALWWLLCRSGHEQKIFDWATAWASRQGELMRWNLIWEKRSLLFYALLIYCLLHLIQAVGVLLLGSSIGDIVAKERYQNGSRGRLLGKTILDFLLLPGLLFHLPVLLGARTLPEWLMRLKKVRLGFFRLGFDLILLPIPIVGFWMLLFVPIFLEYRFVNDGELDKTRAQVKDINQKQDFSQFRFNQNIELGLENFSLLQGKRGEFLPALGLTRSAGKEKVVAELWYWENSTQLAAKDQLQWRLSLQQKFKTKDFFDKIFGSGLILSARYPHLLTDLLTVAESSDEKFLQNFESVSSDLLAAHWQYNIWAMLASLPQHLEAAAYFKQLGQMIPAGSYDFTISQRYLLFVEKKRQQAFVISWGIPHSNLYSIDLGQDQTATSRLMEFLETSRWKNVTENKGTAFKLWHELDKRPGEGQVGEDLYGYYHDFFKQHLSLDIERRLELHGQLQNLRLLLGKSGMPDTTLKSLERSMNAFKAGEKDFFE
jgi:hypothetical protein